MSAQDDQVATFANTDPQEEDLFTLLRTTPFTSKYKNIFWRISGLISMQIDGLIREDQFSTTVREYLSDFTEKDRLLDETVLEVCKVLHSIKYPRVNMLFNKTEDYVLRPAMDDGGQQRRRAVIEKIATQHILPQLTDLLQGSDFGLKTRVELASLAVLLEMGFAEFSRHIKEEIRKIQQSANSNLPIYRKCVGEIMEHTVYLTHRTFGFLHKILYHKVIVNFIDGI